MKMEVKQMKKGQKKRIWTPEQKLEIVQKHLEDHISAEKLGKEYSADSGMICRWVKEYISGGAAGLEPKKRPGNKFAALHRSKNLSELERLRLLVAKQEVEIARLKKGYWVEGAGANKEYVTGQDANTKLLKK
jgi:transposase-like protein